MHINNLLSQYALSATVHITSLKIHCDIIIKYYDNSGQEIGHFTIHIKRDDTSMLPHRRKNGRIHMKTTNACYTMKCNRRKINGANNSVKLYYSKSEKYIRSNEAKCLDATLSVLNDYMDFNSNISIHIPMTTLGTHPCVTKIISAFKTSKRNQIRHTRKAPKQA